MARPFAPVLLGVLLAAAAAIAALGYFMPELRQRYVFAPQQARAERIVGQIVAGEEALYRRGGKFETFSTDDFAAKSRALGLNWDDVPKENFQFDAAMTADNHLRVRALPRGAAVASLNVPASLYVAELSGPGRPVKKGWYP